MSWARGSTEEGLARLLGVGQEELGWGAFPGPTGRILN